jgi:hypothetical protein
MTGLHRVGIQPDELPLTVIRREQIPTTLSVARWRRHAHAYFLCFTSPPAATEMARVAARPYTAYLHTHIIVSHVDERSLRSHARIVQSFSLRWSQVAMNYYSPNEMLP